MTRAAAVTARAGRAIRRELADPALRGGYALLVNTAVTAAIGLAFWILSARLLPVDALGVGTATVAAILTVSNLGQLNLYQSAGVLLSDTASDRRRTIATMTALVVAATAVAGLSAAGLGSMLGWFDELAVPWPVFVLCAIGWSLFALKDGVLIGIRRFAAVPVANVSYGAGKVVALVALAAVWQAPAIVGATFLPLVAILPIVVVMVLRAVPRGGVPARLDLRFLGFDYAGFVMLQACTTLLPFVVLLAADPYAAGIFGTLWMIVTMLDTVAHNAGVPLASEASRFLDDASAMESRARRRTIALVGSAAVIAVMLAEPLLRLFGPAYAENGTTALRLLLIASIPRAYAVLTIALLRAHRRTATIAVLEIGHAICVLGFGVLMLPALGVDGIAIAWLVGQCVLAVACTAVRWSDRRGGGRS